MNSSGTREGGARERQVRAVRVTAAIIAAASATVGVLVGAVVTARSDDTVRILGGSPVVSVSPTPSPVHDAASSRPMPNPAGIRVQGELTLNVGQAVDLDPLLGDGWDPTKAPDSGGGQLDIRLTDAQSIAAVGRARVRVVQRVAGSDPCAGGTFTLLEVPIKPGGQVCVSTGKGRHSLLTVRQLRSSGPAIIDVVTFKKPGD